MKQTIIRAGSFLFAMGICVIYRVAFNGDVTFDEALLLSFIVTYITSPLNK